VSVATRRYVTAGKERVRFFLPQSTPPSSHRSRAAAWHDRSLLAALRLTRLGYEWG